MVCGFMRKLYKTAKVPCIRVPENASFNSFAVK